MNGFEKDSITAFISYQISADYFGNKNSFLKVGECYQNGIGVKKNNQKALEYFQKVKFIDVSEYIVTARKEFEKELGVVCI